MSLDTIPNHYKALGIERSADSALVKNQFRKLVRTCHPDKVKDVELKVQKAEEFTKILQAYEVLGDETRRATYDAELRLQALRREKLRRKRLPADQGHDSERRNSASFWKEDGADNLEPTIIHRAPLKKGSVKGLKGVRGRINGHYVVALGDTGAQQNCIPEQLASELGFEVEYFTAEMRPSFVLGHGKTIDVLGVVSCRWNFAEEHGVSLIQLFVLQDCIFDVILGFDFLYSTDTITTNSYRMCSMPRSQDSLGPRLVNLCGTPVHCLRGNLDTATCSALPDYGAEPNLIAYDLAERRDWLLDMYDGLESCRLLQFVDGSTAKVSGRLKLQWSFLTGWGPIDTDTATYYEFDVLPGCPFDVILGCDFLDETEPFVNHLDSLHKLVKDGLSGLNVVLWVKAKTKKQGNNEVQDSPADRERERKKAERDARMQRLAASEAQTGIGNQDASSQVRSPSPLSTSSSSTSRLTARSGGRPVRSHARDYIPAPTPPVTRMFQPDIHHPSLKQQNERWSRYDGNGIQ